MKFPTVGRQQISSVLRLVQVNSIAGSNLSFVIDTVVNHWRMIVLMACGHLLGAVSPC